MSILQESSPKENSEKKKVPSNYYFVEHEVSPAILEWQKYYERQSEIESFLHNAEEEGYELSENQISELNKELRKNIEEAQPYLDKIMVETVKVIKGVIFRAQFHKREKYDTCYQIAVEACLKSLRRFNPEYGTAFNYLSLTAKNSIRYHLIKKAKKKSLSIDYEYLDDDNFSLKNLIKHEEKAIKNLEIENLTDTILVLIEESGEQKGLVSVTKELREYLFYNQGKYDKKEFFKWAKSDGISSNLLRKFIKFTKEHKERLYEEVGVF